MGTASPHICEFHICRFNQWVFQLQLVEFTDIESTDMMADYTMPSNRKDLNIQGFGYPWGLGERSSYGTSAPRKPRGKWDFPVPLPANF